MDLIENDLFDGLIELKRLNTQMLKQISFPKIKIAILSHNTVKFWIEGYVLDFGIYYLLIFWVADPELPILDTCETIMSEVKRATHEDAAH